MTDQKHEGLPVPGYRAQSAEAVAAVTVMKNVEEQILQLLDDLRTSPTLDVDQRWLAAGRTQLEQAFMSINRAVFKPARVQLAQPSLAQILSD